jgi:hypothetical protein
MKETVEKKINQYWKMPSLLLGSLLSLAPVLGLEQGWA